MVSMEILSINVDEERLEGRSIEETHLLIMVRWHRFSSRRVFYTIIAFFGLTFPLTRILFIYIEETLDPSPGGQNVKRGDGKNVPRAPGQVDINQFGFQAGFVREINEVKSNFPVEDANSTSGHKRLKYLIEEPDLCRQHPDLRIISYIHSAVSKKENRQLIRDTWGSLK
ncbi:hypothetical protein SK128_014353 [Halocaridina rubra]|uniref:Hexosyltransferase n=1 Tax=Halocaridina rubra TaxID=373956 RepID=A0AAN9A4I4_HALRR